MLHPKIFTALRSYSLSDFFYDIYSGMTVAVIAFPIVMAYSIASGLPPERGIFTAIVAGFIAALLGGSRVQITGPTGAFIIIISGIIPKYGYEGLVYCTFMASIFLIIFGLFKMGKLIKFIPFPVTTGFMSGIGLVVFSTQVKEFLGLKIEALPAEFIDKWIVYFQNLDKIDPYAVLLGTLTIIIVIFIRRISLRLPSMLIGMAVATFIAVLFHLDLDTIGTRFGDLPRMLPMPSLPNFDLVMLKDLILPAFTVALLAAIEALLSITVIDGMIGSHNHPNTELVAQGFGNIASSLFGGIPASGAVGRTITNIKSGAKTPIAGMFHSVTMLFILFFLLPFSKMIPLASLAGIMVIISVNMSGIRHFRHILKAPRSDVAVLITTFTLTVLINLTIAVEVGVVLAALLFMRRMSELTDVEIITKEIIEGGEEPVDHNAISLRNVPKGVEVYEIKGPFFFGAADRFKQTMRMIDKNLSVVILRLRNVPTIDATGVYALREFFKQCKRNNIVLILSGVHAQPLLCLKRYGLLSELGNENLAENIDEALKIARNIIGLPLTGEKKDDSISDTSKS